MGNIRVGHGLDRDQRIFRFISFYDFIDLLTFSQISFSGSETLQLRHPLHAPRKQGSSFRTIPSVAARDQGAATVLNHDFSVKEVPLGIIAHQAWTLLDREDLINWHAPDMSRPRICIISSIRALSESLFTDDSTNVFIERPYRVLQDFTASDALHTLSATMLHDNTVSLIVNSAKDRPHPNRQPASLRLLVDLKTLLAGVLVSPDASIRFLELASKLVQQTTLAFVSRARRPNDVCRKSAHRGISIQQDDGRGFALG